jgi:hypothetical protein
MSLRSFNLSLTPDGILSEPVRSKLVQIHPARLEPDSFTRIASRSLAEGKVPVRLQSGREGDGVVGREETLFAEGVVVERAAVVLALGGALRAALFNVGDGADVGVGEREVRAGLVHVLAVGGN